MWRVFQSLWNKRLFKQRTWTITQFMQAERWHINISWQRRRDQESLQGKTSFSKKEWIELILEGFSLKTAIKDIGNLITPMLSFITRKMVMKHIIYGMHIHVRFMDWPITMYPSVGRDELFIWKFCWLERRLTMKNIILVSKRRNTRRTRRDKNFALVVKWVDIG